MHKDGEADYLARSKPSYFMNRSATTELDLEAGQYVVMIKITASRDKSATTPEEVVKKNCQTRPEKLMAVGLSYDLAHAKGHLKDSELERKERLRRERRDKRRLKARRAFEAQRKVLKKEKLRRLRLEAKEKAKRPIELKEDSNADSGIEISIKVGESKLESMKLQGADDARGGSKVVSQEGARKLLKITVEACDKAENGKGGDQTTSGEIQQPIEGGCKQAEDTKQALEGTKNEGKEHKDKNTEVKAVSTTESEQESKEAGSNSTSSTFGVTPATSAENSTATEDSEKAKGQLNVRLEENSAAGEKITDTKATTDTGGNLGENANQSNLEETNIQLQNLTLDNISDDGLSWNSDIDAPSDSSSETGSDSDSDSDTNVDEPGPSSTRDQSTDDPANDPWNAVCVFGLRLYSKGSQAKIEVVRKQDSGDSNESKKLDVDDQAADATKKLQKGSAREEKQLETVGTAPAWDEESKQG